MAKIPNPKAKNHIKTSPLSNLPPFLSPPFFIWLPECIDLNNASLLVPVSKHPGLFNLYFFRQNQCLSFKRRGDVDQVDF